MPTEPLLSNDLLDPIAAEQPAGTDLRWTPEWDLDRLSSTGGTMSILWTLIIGLVIGAVAKLLMPGKDPGGFIITILLGIAGSFVGTYIGRALGLYAEGQSAGFIMSVIGALILLVIYHLIRRRTA